MNINRKTIYSKKVYEHISDFPKSSSEKWNMEKHNGKKIFLTQKGISVKFLGTHSLYITDGEKSFLIDPYFSRVKYVPLEDLNDNYNPVSDPEERDWHGIDEESNNFVPNINEIHKALKKADINKIDAILITHAHFDHALDIAEVSKYFHGITGEYPLIIGCKSVAYVALGGLMSDSEFESYQSSSFNTMCSKYNIKVINGKSYECSYSKHLKIKFIKGRHIKLPFVSSKNFIGGKIENPIRPPARLSEYNEGILYNILFEHDIHGRLLTMGSANYIENDFKNMFQNKSIKIDAMIIGVAGLNVWRGAFVGNKGLFDGKGIDDYYDEVVKPCNPKAIYFSHWDDFETPLDQPMKWFTKPWKVFEEFDKKDVSKLIDLYYLPLWEKIQIFPFKKKGK